MNQAVKLLRPPRIVLVFLLSLFPIQGTAVEAVALITDVIGGVSLMRDGETTSCEILLSLFPGDKLQVSDNASLTLVYFESSKEYSFTEKAMIQINADAAEFESGSGSNVRNLNVGKKKILPLSDDLNQAAMVLRSTARKQKIELLRPVNTKIINTKPTFFWSALEQATQYRFTLTDDYGKTVIETPVKGISFQLPADTNIEAEVFYTWRVEAHIANGTVYSNSSNFTLLDEKQRDELAHLDPGSSASYSERVVFALLLEQIGVCNEARARWDILAKERPNNASLRVRAGT